MPKNLRHPLGMRGKTGERAPMKLKMVTQRWRIPVGRMAWQPSAGERNCRPRRPNFAYEEKIRHAS